MIQPQQIICLNRKDKKNKNGYESNIFPFSIT